MLAYTPLEARHFDGEVAGRRVQLITLRNTRGMTLRFTTLGAKVLQIVVPDRDGTMDDVALGYDSLESVLHGQPSMGAFVGRFANRIGRGSFPLEGVTWRIAPHDESHVLHGGRGGSCFAVFDVLRSEPSRVELTLHYRQDRDGFPGNLMSRVAYSLTEDNAFHVQYDAVCDSPTVVNMTSHVFFNLAGERRIGAASLARHELMLNSDAFTPVDGGQLPTGEVRSVTGTPMDFRRPTAIGERLDEVRAHYEPGTGYDHNWVVRRGHESLALAARVCEPVSGRVLEVLSTEPGIVFYGGNNLAGQVPRDVGKGGVKYEARSALCLEPAHFPDSPNHPHFPSTLLRPGQWFSGHTIYRFGVM